MNQNGKQLGASVTPHTTGSSPAGAGASSASGAATVTPMQVRLLDGTTGEETIVELKATTKLSKVTHAFAAQKNTTVDALQYYHRNALLNPNSNASIQEHGIGDGSEITVVARGAPPPVTSQPAMQQPSAPLQTSMPMQQALQQQTYPQQQQQLQQQQQPPRVVPPPLQPHQLQQQGQVLPPPPQQQQQNLQHMRTPSSSEPSSSGPPLPPSTSAALPPHTLAPPPYYDPATAAAARAIAESIAAEQYAQEQMHAQRTGPSYAPPPPLLPPAAPVPQPWFVSAARHVLQDPATHHVRVEVLVDGRVAISEAVPPPNSHAVQPAGFADMMMRIAMHHIESRTPCVITRHGAAVYVASEMVNGQYPFAPPAPSPRG
ncbi:hypothetical protein H9P43_008642 [Blastocladiella emersonii ATCC 22665]|nr:hypothetical protein H9P43_008642 [Blastocladiella emersonii ATCC 22665]